jgi:hypothetical protein
MMMFKLHLTAKTQSAVVGGSGALDHMVMILARPSPNQ